MPHRLPRVSGRETELPLVTCCAAETREGQALSFASARVCKRIGSPLVNLKCSESRGWAACPLNVPLTPTRIAAHGCARAQFYVFHVRPARSIFSNALRPRCAVHARLRAKPYTRMEFTSFEANAAQSPEERRMVILRCEDAPLLGLFAPHVDQDLVGIGEPEERKEPYPCRCGRTFPGIAAATATVHWCAAAHCELHRSRRRTRSARRHSDAGQARCRCTTSPSFATSREE